jgi:hypothetical protein
MSDRPDLDEAMRIAEAGGLKLTGGKYAPDVHPTPELDKALSAKDDPDFLSRQIRGAYYLGYLASENKAEYNETTAAGLIKNLHEFVQDLTAAVPEKDQQNYSHIESAHKAEGWNMAIDTTTTAQAAILEKWGLK